MLEFLLIIILLPFAIAAGAALLFGAVLFWKYILAVGLWVAAAITMFYGWLTHTNTFWWAFGIFMVGCLVWAMASSENDEEPAPHKKH